MRYIRQMQLPEIGEEGQKRLKNARVLVVGAGGLGAYVLPLLVGAGVGFIRLYDADCIDETNLHRQTLYRMSDVGTAKVDVASKTLNDLNPEVLVETHQNRLGVSDLMVAMQNIDVVVDAGDNFATTYLLSDFCFSQNIPLVSASVLMQKGYVGVFCGGAPSYRALFPRVSEQNQDCNTVGVLGSAVGILGSMQAQMTLSVLLDFKPSVLGVFVQIDCLTWQMNRLHFMQESEPQQPYAQFIDTHQLHTEDCIVDLRSSEEIYDALPPPVHHFTQAQLKTYPFLAHQRIVLVCKTGYRALKASYILQNRGYTSLAILAVGI